MSALIALRSYLFRYKVAIIGGFLILILTNAVALILPYLIRLAVDSLHAGTDPGLLLRYGLLIVCVGLAQAVIGFFGRYILAEVSRKIEYELRAELFKYFEKLELDYFQHNKLGDLVARATNDLTAVRGLLGPGISNFMNTTVAFTATIIFMLTIDVRLTLYSASVLPLISVVFYLVARKIEQSYKLVQDQFGEVSAQAQENLSGIRSVKAYTQENYELEAFRTANQEYVRRSINYAKLYALLWPAMYFLAGLASVILLWRGGLDVIEGRLTLGQLVQFTGYLAQLTWPMIAFGWVVNLFQQGAASMIRINEVMKHQPTIADPVNLDEALSRNGAAIKDRLRGKVEFRHVSFTYTEREVLHDINIRVRAGSSLAIVGPTGTGKSTLVNLVPRLFDVSRGQVLIDDVDVREIPLALLRRQIGFVPQETFLFSVPLAENIGFGVEKLSKERLQEVMQYAQLSKDVEDFPDGVATMIGERGVTLSGGQKQRTSLARAIAKEPTILILDDAMSSVDTHTEADILKHLQTVMRGRTTIVISHRCSTVKNLDHIVVLDEGRIVEEGTHETLLQLGGLYAEMYRRQLLGEELEDSDNGDIFSGR
ncbi:MAG TPA: ABC transporter ATP-binding protein [Ktedonobacteraceae bacterium]|nr:ABC transporter ATP-binding protein [Ktedonobacteraceae bacterium]